jgi:predicted nucleotidyltransferase
MFTEEEIIEIVYRIVRLVKPSKVFLFGSYVKKSATINSDLDLLIVMESKLPRQKRAASIKSLISGYAIPVNVIVYTPSEIEAQRKNKYSFISSVLSFAKELYSGEALQSKKVKTRL